MRMRMRMRIGIVNVNTIVNGNANAPVETFGQLFSGCCCQDGMEQKQVGSTGLLLFLLLLLLRQLTGSKQ